MWFQKLKWELVDLGSLNGTLLNSQPINHPDSGSRHWGDPVELASGNVITLGTTSSIYVSQCALMYGFNHIISFMLSCYLYVPTNLNTCK